jgi:ComF family protein
MENILMDILFPVNECSLCREKGRYHSRRPWCGRCQDEIMNATAGLPLCRQCGKYLEQPGENLCQECRENPPEFKIARAVGPYCNDKLRKAIKVFKFLCRRYMSIKMGEMMAAVVIEEPDFWPIDMIIPVPISQGNLKQRGFNQSELLAKQIAKILKKRMYPKLLRRVKETQSQRELTREERAENLLCAFEVTAPAQIKGKNILLVDDVYTTGSTIRECTRTLMEAGAESVAVITWAIGTGY